MNQKVFCIFDSKARAYLPPFFLPEEGMAVRVFKDCCNSDSHQFGKHPEDYTLFRLGTFDDSTGLLRPLMAPEAIHNGIELVGGVEKVTLEAVQ